MAAFVHRLLPRADDDANLWPFGSSRGPSRAPLPALHLMHGTLIAIIPFGMRGLFSPLGCTLHSFGTSTDPWPKQLTMPSSSYMTRPSKRLPSVTSPFWGTCPAALAIPAKPQAALGLGGLPKRCVQCLMSFPSAFALRASRYCRRNCLTIVQTLLIDDLPPRPDLNPRRPSESQGPEAGCPLVVLPRALVEMLLLPTALTSIMPCGTPSLLMTSAGTGLTALMRVLVSLRHMTGALCCRCHNESNRGSTRSWP